MRTVLLSAVALAGCFNPAYDHPACGPNGECPAALTCMTGTCVATTTGGDGPGAGDGATANDGPMGRDLSTDRTKFFGTSRCAQSGTQLCDGFETGTLDPQWTVTGTPVTIDTLQAARGSHALHIVMNANGASYIKETKTFPEVPNIYYGRAFVYFKSLPTPPAMTYSHWTVFAGATDLGEIRVSGQLQNNRNLFGVGTDSGSAANGTGDWTTSDADNGPMAVPLGQWICIEWMNDGVANETRFWWDASEHPSLHTTMTVHGGNSNPYKLDTFTAAWFGWQEYQSSTEPFELWIDEVAIDNHRIGCVI